MMFDAQLHELKIQHGAEVILLRRQWSRSNRVLAPKRLLRRHPYAATGVALAAGAALIMLPRAFGSRHASAPREESQKPGMVSKLIHMFMKQAKSDPHAAPANGAAPHGGDTQKLVGNLNQLLEIGTLLASAVMGRVRGPAQPPSLDTANVGSLPTYDLPTPAW